MQLLATLPVQIGTVVNRSGRRAHHNDKRNFSVILMPQSSHWNEHGEWQIGITKRYIMQNASFGHCARSGGHGRYSVGLRGTSSRAQPPSHFDAPIKSLE